MKIKRIITECGDLIIELDGEFDALGSSRIRPVLEKIASQSKPEYVFIDLKNVSFIDSSGVGAIVFLYKRLKENARKLSITHVSGQPRALLELLRIHKAIPVVLSKDENSVSESKSWVA